MVSLTLSIPPELKKRMDRHPEIRWSRIVRSIIKQSLDDLEQADRLASKSKLTQKDVDELAERFDKEAAKKWQEINK